MAPSYTEQQAREAIAASSSWAESLRRLGMSAGGGGGVILRKYAVIWNIPTDHFDPRAASRAALQRAGFTRIPLDELLVEGRAVNSAGLNERLYEAGVKQRLCELCGQDENWRGKTMSLILDHVNGVRLDNRLENLRIVCPNCNATLDTHCGRNRPRVVSRACARCGDVFRPRYADQRFCSRACGTHEQP